MSRITFEDVVEARMDALEDGEIPVTARLTEEDIGSLKGDTRAVSTDEDEFLPDDDDIVARVNALDVVEGDRNVLVTESGTEYEIDYE